MRTKYFALLTQLGADKLANAAALGTQLNITHMAVGDGGGTLPTPDTAQTQLVNERRRAAINVLSVDPQNTNQIIAEQIIPENEGGWWIREIGLFDNEGILIAIGNCAETYKPQLQEGSGRTQTIRMVLIVSHTDAVTLKIDPSVVLATREYADSVVANAIREHEQSRRHPDATLKEKGFVSLSSAVNSNSETQAATPKAVKTAYDLAATANQNAASANNNANARLEKSKNGADILDKPAFVKNLGLAGTVDLAKNAYPKTGGVVYGSIDATGYLSSNAVYEAGGIRVYSANNKPTPDDIGAYSKGGGLVNGNVDATGYVSANGIYEASGIRVYSPLNKPTSVDIGLGVGSALPFGVPIPWPAADAPAGWLKCNGTYFDLAKYPALASVYPSGKLPDLRGVFIRGWSDDGPIDAGRTLLSFATDKLKKHTHDLLFGSGRGYDTPAVHEDYRRSASSVYFAAAGSSGLYISEEGSNETAPCNVAYNYIVRAA
ncbi:phage tail-collar fiber domain-containing protein [Xenorhabdus taiwanensis]|uniref:Phage tail protein n=1 Tax=Xenorhabdus taiwanensis TaxID=3085177 RepID=A0ABM8JUR1_9GAMM|nr:phage tail protein [Xenorhabdus sp. TCT-1]